jgi:hypothetical protein
MPRNLSGIGTARRGRCLYSGHEHRLVYDERCVGVVSAVGREYPSSIVVGTACMAVVSTGDSEYHQGWLSARRCVVMVSAIAGESGQVWY